MNKDKKKAEEKNFDPKKQGREGSEVEQCQFCRKLFSPEEVIPTKSKKFACENCYDPNDLEQQGEELPEIEENTQKTLSKTFSNTFTSESEKNEQKAIEILNIEELNNQVEIPKELNIIDCPPDVNSNPEWFRIQFRNF